MHADIYYHLYYNMDKRKNKLWYQRVTQDFLSDPIVSKYRMEYKDGRQMIEVLLELRSISLNLDGKFFSLYNGEEKAQGLDRIRMEHFPDIKESILKKYIKEFIVDGLMSFDETSKMYSMNDYGSYASYETGYAQEKRTLRARQKKETMSPFETRQCPQDDGDNNETMSHFGTRQCPQDDGDNNETMSQKNGGLCHSNVPLDNKNIELRVLEKLFSENENENIWPESLKIASEELIQFHYNGKDKEIVKTYSKFSGFTKTFVKNRIFNEIHEYIKLDEEIKSIMYSYGKSDFSEAVKLTAKNVKEQLKQNKRITNLTQYTIDSLIRNLNGNPGYKINGEDAVVMNKQECGNQLNTRSRLNDEEISELPFICGDDDEADEEPF